MQFYDNSIQFTSGAIFMVEITNEDLLEYEVTQLGTNVTCSKETTCLHHLVWR